MAEPHAQDGTLESWKQIAAYLDRSERTVRRWEATEGLPIHRREHGKQDTVFAYTREIDEWRRLRTREAPPPEPVVNLKRRCWLLGSSLAAAALGVGAVGIRTTRQNANPVRADRVSQADAKSGNYLTEHQAITRTIHRYIAGGRAGNADMMRPAFHPEATLAGYCQGVEHSGSIEHLFKWVDENGPAPNIEPLVARIEVFNTIAIVNLEVRGWSGTLAGEGARISEVFTLLKRGSDWTITQKTFHWHEA